MTIELRIDNDKLSVLENTGIVSGSKNYYMIKAAFSPDWAELNKYLILSANGGSLCSVELVNCDKAGLEATAMLPEGLIQTGGTLELGILGKKGDETRISTNREQIKIIKGVSEADCPPPLPEAGSVWRDYVSAEVNEAVSSLSWIAPFRWEIITPQNCDYLYTGVYKFKRGWTYLVGYDFDFTYYRDASVSLHAGDIIIALRDYDSSLSPANSIGLFELPECPAGFEPYLRVIRSTAAEKISNLQSQINELKNKL